MTDMVKHPPHYTHASGVETLEITQEMSFLLGGVFKYLTRYEKKGSPVLDLQKASRLLEVREAQGSFEHADQDHFSGEAWCAIDMMMEKEPPLRGLVFRAVFDIERDGIIDARVSMVQKFIASEIERLTAHSEDAGQ